MATTISSTKSTTKKTTSKSKASKPVAKKKASTAAAAKKTTTKKTTTKSSKSTKKTPVVAPTPVVSTAKTSKKTTSANSLSDRFKNLNIWNYALAALHAVQGVAILVLSRSDSLFPVSTSYITTDSLASSEGAPALIQAQRQLFDLNLAYVVAAFFFLSALAHLVIATVYRRTYEANLERGINKARWIEYGTSASVMMVGIAMLAGVSDLSTLLLIFGATKVMNLCGLIMEVHNQKTERTNWLSFIVGTMAGLLPWIVLGIYFYGANVYGSGSIPTFVYAIYGSMFLFFSSFAVNMYLQYKGKGRWSDYLFGEKGYMVLSLVAKSALAWQIFAGTLRP